MPRTAAIVRPHVDKPAPYVAEQSAGVVKFCGDRQKASPSRGAYFLARSLRWPRQNIDTGVQLLDTSLKALDRPRAFYVFPWWNPVYSATGRTEIGDESFCLARKRYSVPQGSDPHAQIHRSPWCNA
jgi:hypothetical protein